MTGKREKSRRRLPAVAWLLVPAALLLFAGANAHLVYVAFESQPDCVPHLKDGDFRAAKPAC